MDYKILQATLISRMKFSEEHGCHYSFSHGRWYFVYMHKCNYGKPDFELIEDFFQSTCDEIEKLFGVKLQPNW